MKELFKNKTQMKKHIKLMLNNWMINKDKPDLILWLVSEYRAEVIDHVFVQKDNYGNNQFSTYAGSFSYIKAVDFVYGKKETSKPFRPTKDFVNTLTQPQANVIG